MKEFEMTKEQRARILNASRPVPYMVFGGIEPRSPQENANDAWREPGRRAGVRLLDGSPSSRKKRPLLSCGAHGTAGGQGEGEGANMKRTILVTTKEDRCDGCRHRLRRHRQYLDRGRNRHGSTLVCSVYNCQWTECFVEQAVGEKEKA